MKPQLICDHNNIMGDVDRADQEFSYYETTRKQQKKYYKKVFRHRSLFNAFIIFKKVTNNIFIEWRLLKRFLKNILRTYPPTCTEK